MRGCRMSCSDAVDGFLLRLQRRLEPLKKEESNGTNQDGWIGYSEVDLPLGGRTQTDSAFHVKAGITYAELMSVPG